MIIWFSKGRHISQIYDFLSYKIYLKHRLGAMRARTGLKKLAAEAMGCQTAYLSQVLNADAHLNLEQAYAINDFLEHDSDEKDFFILLVQFDRAGTKDLKKYFKSKIQNIIDQRTQIKSRVNTDQELSIKDQAIYYSNWLYACAHVMVSIPHLQTKTAITDELKLPMAKISQVLDFLETNNLIILKDGKYQIGPRHLHLDNNSPLISKHHTNWRIKAIESMNLQKPLDLHYSVVVTLSLADIEKIRQRILDFIQANMQIIKDSKEEDTYVFALDYFKI